MTAELVGAWMNALNPLLAAAWQVAEPIVSAWLKRDERRVGGDA